MLKIKNIKYIAISIIVITLLVSAILLLSNKTESTNNAYLKSDYIVIRPKVSGYINKIFIKDNQKLKKGDVIAQIEDIDFKLKVIQAEANLEKSKAKIAEIKEKFKLYELMVQESSAKLEAAQASFDLANKNLMRSQKLISNGSSSQKSLDKDNEIQKNSKSSVQIAKTDLLSDKQQLVILSASLEELQAQYKNDEASLELAKIDLENTTIKAATDGTISNRNLQIGQLVQSSNALAYLIQDNDIWTIANFKEVQLEHLKTGIPVSITVDAFPKQEFTGKIDSLSPATGAEFSILPPENATGNFTKIVQRVPVKIVFNPDQNLTNLKSGMSVFVKIKI